MHAEPSPAFVEAPPGARPIRELGLTIVGSALEPILAEFEGELAAAGIRVRPRFYLSTEWGVPFETVAIAIPFYLTRPELAEQHAERTGLVEGVDRDDILRYLRHEMGHVLNYAYRLYDRPDWIERFGAITQPYLEAYRPEPWSDRFVRHLPGWYAQKHPDEDWAETFAVWATPGQDWRVTYAAWPRALAKLALCDIMMADLRDRDPEITDDELDEDVSEIDYSIDEFYDDQEVDADPLPPGLDGGLRAIFAAPVGDDDPSRRSAAGLITAHARALARAVFTWTGHFPEATRLLLRHLADHAEAADLRYRDGDQDAVLIGLTALVTSLAMNHVHRGTYAPLTADQ